MDHDVGLNLSLPMSTQPNDVVVTPPKMPKRTEIHGISWNWIDLRIQYIYIYMYIDYIDIHRYRSTVLLFGIPNGGFTRYLPLLSPMVPPAPPEAWRCKAFCFTMSLVFFFSVAVSHVVCFFPHIGSKWRYQKSKRCLMVILRDCPGTSWHFLLFETTVFFKPPVLKTLQTLTVFDCSCPNSPFGCRLWSDGGYNDNEIKLMLKRIAPHFLRHGSSNFKFQCFVYHIVGQIVIVFQIKHKPSLRCLPITILIDIVLWNFSKHYKGSLNIPELSRLNTQALNIMGLCENGASLIPRLYHHVEIS